MRFLFPLEVGTCAHVFSAARAVPVKLLKSYWYLTFAVLVVCAVFLQELSILATVLDVLMPNLEHFIGCAQLTKTY